MKIHVYTDPGHGWASVPVSLLVDLGIDQLALRVDVPDHQPAPGRADVPQVAVAVDLGVG